MSCEVLLLFRVGVRESIEIQKYAFLQYMEATGPIHTVDETLGSVCLVWNTAEEMDHDLKRVTGILVKEIFM